MSDEVPLFDLSAYPIGPKPRKPGHVKARVWTEVKADLVMRYLRYFVYITKHGTYIDAFAGPQSEDHSWAAKLVIESKPKRLRNFFLFEIEPPKIKKLRALQEEQPSRPKRLCRVYAQDVNKRIVRHFEQYPVPPKEPTFCLLDQHTFECDWATVELVARHKKKGNKIELFYFLANAWLSRAFAGHTRDLERLPKWWGRDDWETLKRLSGVERARVFMKRFTDELGYTFAEAYPIYETKSGGKTMFFMIHASDHPEARTQMVRAYNKATLPYESEEELEFEFSAKGPRTRG